MTYVQSVYAPSILSYNFFFGMPIWIMSTTLHVIVGQEQT